MPNPVFSVSFRPRFRDTDMLGHVNNAVFVTYLETARSEWYLSLRESGKLSDDMKNFSFILARVEIDYRTPLFLGTDVVVDMYVGNIGNKSWEFTYNIRDTSKEKLFATAKSVQVFFNYKTQKSSEIPEVMREALQSFQS